jgi:hypothetical protein
VWKSTRIPGFFQIEAKPINDLSLQQGDRAPLFSDKSSEFLKFLPTILKKSSSILDPRLVISPQKTQER